MSSNIDPAGTHAGDTSESEGTLPDVQIYARKSVLVRSIWERSRLSPAPRARMLRQLRKRKRFISDPDFQRLLP